MVASLVGSACGATDGASVRSAGASGNDSIGTAGGLTGSARTEPTLGGSGKGSVRAASAGVGAAVGSSGPRSVAHAGSAMAMAAAAAQPTLRERLRGSGADKSEVVLVARV